MRERAALACLFTALFSIVYGSSSFLQTLVCYRFELSNGDWPFWPQLAPLYLSLDLLLVIAVFKLPRASLYRFFTALCWQTLLVWPIFILLPVEPLSPPVAAENWTFKFADWLNLEGNYCPSLHVCYATTCAYFLANPVVYLWSAGIAVSTVLLYQHYPLDAVAGLILSLAVCWWTGRGVGRILASCASDLLRCVLRHRRYLISAVALVLNLLFHPRRGQVALIGFCYLQRLDDILDGHLNSGVEPEVLVRSQLEQWRSGEFAKDDLSTMGARLSWSFLPQDKILALIEEMILDRQRVREQARLKARELSHHLDTTFQLSLDLMLCCSGSDLSSADVPSLVELLSWCSVVRDLEEDLALGLVNIPSEVLEKGCYIEWFEERLQRARALYESAAEELALLKGRRGRSLLWLFHRSVKKYITNHDSQSLASILEIALGR